ncbi:MAG: CinA family nicotinamide mononucleotide deamidase-related protein, partial [Planctomycetota bacterium]|nr:CinA family nicotinamide mononucleotide deamidase-related protein [Planctomycetota bacterium]
STVTQRRVAVPPSDARRSFVRAVILSIGAELVSGLRLDTHSAEISRALTAIGIEVVRHATVDDGAADIEKALRAAVAEADLVVATGCLGPTLDDCTREALAAAAGVPLDESPEAREHLVAWAKARGRVLSESNFRQALLPRGARPIPNPIGTALGIEARIGNALVLVMPGVPAEMTQMLQDEVLPRLRQAAPGRATIIRTVHTYGLPESIVGEKLADLMAPKRHPHVGTAVHGGMIDIHIYATGALAEIAPLLDADAAAVRERLGDSVFGEGGARLEDAVAALLAKRRATIALAESCTGGLVAAKLVNVPGISEFLLEGVVAYAIESKVRTLGVAEGLIRSHGTVSEPVARAMAEGVRARNRASISLGVTGIAGPGGGTAEKPVGLVWFAVADEKGTVAAKEVFSGDRTLIRERAANYALNLLRLRLMASEPQP